MILLFCLRAALAQSVTMPSMNGDLYRLPIDSQETLWTDDAGRAANGHVTARVATDYLHGPLALRVKDFQGTHTTQLVGDAFGLVLAGGVSWGPVRVGLALPTWLLATSDLAGAGGAGLGDLYIDVKGTVLDPETAPIGLAIAGGMSLPTGTVSVALSNPGVRWNARLIADRRFGKLLLAANLGHVDQPVVEVGRTKVTDAFLFRLGSAYQLGDRGGVSLELAGQLTYGKNFFTALGTPLEAMVGGWAHVGQGLVVRGGLGTGLTSAPGSPVVRTVIALSWDSPTKTDRDGDTIVDRKDQCPDKPEDFDGYQDQDGCPDGGPPKPAPVVEAPAPSTPPTPHVQITRERIELGGRVYFDTNKATIRPESYSLLDEVAKTMEDHPEILQVRIDGHTDDRGTVAFNQRLSERRAAAVLDYLVAQGVDKSRLTSRGFGESEPLVQGENEAAWAKNRRVEFRIAKWADEESAPSPEPTESPEPDPPMPPGPTSDPATGR